MRRTAAITSALIGLACCGVFAVQTEAFDTNALGEKMAIVFRLTPQFDKWIMGARVLVDLRIENHGPGVVELPNPMFTSSPEPLYRLRAPSGNEQLFRPDQRAKSARDIVPVTLDAGQAWIGELVLSDYSPLKDAGVYQLSAELAWQGAQASAAPAQFEILSAKFGDLSAALSQTPQGEANRSVLLLQNGAVPDAVLAGITEHDTRNAELDALDYLRIGALPAGTQHVYGAYANYATAFDPLTWIVSSGSQAITVGTSLDAKSTQIAFARPILQVLTPLALKSHQLYVFALLDAAPGAELAFAATGGAAGLVARATPQILWRGERPAASAATLTPDPAGRSCLVALAHNTAAGVTMTVLKFDLAGKLLGQTEQSLGGQQATDGVAIHWGTRHEILLSIMARPTGNVATPAGSHATPAGSHEAVQLIEWTFNEDLKPVKSAARSPVWSLSEPLAGSTVAYFEQSLGAPRRVAILRGQRGSSWVVDRQDRLKSLGTLIPGSSPVALVPGADAWYALFLGPAGVASRSF
jgi:hypothetical protein